MADISTFPSRPLALSLCQKFVSCIVMLLVPP